MSSAVSNILPNPLSHKLDGSPNSISTLSSSPACNFSPNQATYSQPNCVSSTSNSVGGNGYQVYGVSPTEGSTASGIGSGNIGPMSNVENSLTGNIDNSIKMKNENDFYNSDDPNIMHQQQMSTNISNHDPSIPSTPAIPTASLDDDDEEENSSYSSPPHQPPPQMTCYDQIVYPRKLMYPISDRNIIARLPYAFNRPTLPYPYPVPEGASQELLNRSPPYPPYSFIRYMPHPMNGMLPPGVIPPGAMPPPFMHPHMMPPSHPSMQIPNQNVPAPAPAKPKARARKQNNNSNNNNNNNQQQPHNLPPQMPMMQPGHMMMRPQMDMSRASSSAMGPPNMAIHQNMKMNGSLKPPVKRYHGCKIVEKGKCGACAASFNRDNLGVICTALSQGCSKSFHPRCQGLNDEAINVLLSKENIEWVCKMCSQKQIIWNIDL